MLDDTQNNADPNANFYGHGNLDSERWAWLKSELQLGQTQGKLMIISAHIPINYLPLGQPAGWNPTGNPSQQEIMDELNSYPNLLLWLAGHLHTNEVSPMPSPDPTRPELGFWEVETSSLRDFPQQFRTFDLIRNSDNAISIFITNVDPIMEAGSLPALSRTYAIANNQIINGNPPYSPACCYNAELIKQLTPEMQAKIQNYGTPLSK